MFVYYVFAYKFCVHVIGCVDLEHVCKVRILSLCALLCVHVHRIRYD